MFVLSIGVFYVWLYVEIVLKRCMLGAWQDSCMMACAVVFVCRFIRELRHRTLT